MTYAITDEDVEALRIIAHATGAQGKWKKRDYDVAQASIKAVLKRMVKVD